MDKLDCVTGLWPELVTQKKKHAQNRSNNKYGSWVTPIETAERRHYEPELSK